MTSSLCSSRWVEGVEKAVLVRVGGFSIDPVKIEVASYDNKTSSI